MVSLADPTANSKMSAPVPPVKVSFPKPPKRMSFPSPPIKISFPDDDQITSFPVPPSIVILSARLESGDVRSTTSSPSPALISSTEIILSAYCLSNESFLSVMLS